MKAIILLINFFSPSVRAHSNIFDLYSARRNGFRTDLVPYRTNRDRSIYRGWWRGVSMGNGGATLVAIACIGCLVVGFALGLLLPGAFEPETKTMTLRDGWERCYEVEIAENHPTFTCPSTMTP